MHLGDGSILVKYQGIANKKLTSIPIIRIVHGKKCPKRYSPALRGLTYSEYLPILTEKRYRSIHQAEAMLLIKNR